MKLNKWMQVVLVSSSVLTLAACSSHKKPNGSDVYAANSAYGAEASGLGRESGFGERGGEQVLAKRVYYFDYDSNVVHEKDMPAVVANSNYIAKNPHVNVTVQGHTDPRGSREYNVGLGERRAKAVAAIAEAKGAKASQLRVVSYGAEKLAASGHSEADYQQDRRVILTYTKS